MMKLIISKGFYTSNKDNIIESLLEIHSNKPAASINDEEYVYYDAEGFLHGYCHIFAYALYQKFGYEIYEISNSSESVIHWCCISKYDGIDVYIDVRGITSNFNEFLNEFQPDIGAKPKMKIIDDIEKYNDEWIQELLDFANELIDRYYDYYSIDLIHNKNQM